MWLNWLKNGIECVLLSTTLYSATMFLMHSLFKCIVYLCVAVYYFKRVNSFSYNMDSVVNSINDPELASEYFLPNYLNNFLTHQTITFLTGCDYYLSQYYIHFLIARGKFFASVEELFRLAQDRKRYAELTVNFQSWRSTERRRRRGSLFPVC